MVYRADGSIVKALEPLNSWAPFDGSDLDENGTFRFLIEAAANPVIQVPYEYEPTSLGDKATAGDDYHYHLADMAVALRDRTVWELLQDVIALDGLVDVLPATAVRRAQIVDALERMVDAMNPDDIPGTAARGREILAPALATRSADSALQVTAVGHAHIDCAWLWPTRETIRKVARTFSNVLDLAERDQEFVFAASSAQQFAWLRAHQPALFERVRAAVAAGVIRPVGGMWVESDTNMPGGEALVRQFVLGSQFFLEEFGVETDIVWLPDSFGYTAALPQIARAAGARYFLTQKPSWNEINPMPHSTFEWEGIDGSRVFTHFPPAETYNSDLGARDLARTERTFHEKGRAKNVLGLFGWGDGGGGPTREMLAMAQRKRDLDGSPRVQLGDPHSFFVAAETELTDPPVWAGEMYLELHRGTLISQQRSKRGNRHSEALLREVELWAATAAVLHGAPYPYEQLRRCWEVVLLQQFHDILPGSSIAWVHQEAERNYAQVEAELIPLRDAALAAVSEGDAPVAVNSGPLARRGVAGMGIDFAEPVQASQPVQHGDRIVFDDPALRVELDSRGVIVSAYDRTASRELVPAGLNAGLLQLFRDTPREWDAWDIDDEDKRSVRDLLEPASVTIEQDAVRIRHDIGSSTIELSIRVADGRIDYEFDIDWHESQKLLKLAFPLDVRAKTATSEIQFGHIDRPLHQNTSWDEARFETVAHRWVHVGEPGYGVAVANDVVYGHDIRSGRTADDRPITVVRLSLLRAPRYPDPAADQGTHRFTVSLRPGGIPEAIEDGYRQHLPLRERRGAPVAPLVAVDNPAIVVESVKLAEDRSGDLVARLYEAHGGRCSTALKTTFDWSEIVTTDLLERRIESDALTASADQVTLSLRPFQLVTLRFSNPTATR
jgi:alpha-mannosidase